MPNGTNPDLRGYDMVVSLNQSAIYNGLQNVFLNGVFNTPNIIPIDEAKYKAADESGKAAIPRIEIDGWYAPYPVFDNSDAANSNITVYFLIKQGFVFYWKQGADYGTNNPVYLPLDEWAIKFDVNMNLVEAAKTLGKNTPQSVQDQIKNFKDSDFQVNTLLMDFNDVDLMENTWEFIPPCNVPSDKPNPDIPKIINGQKVTEGDWAVDKMDDVVSQQLVPIMKNFLAFLKDSNAPYVFGYTASSNNEPTEAVSTFVPTGTSFSTTRVNVDTYDGSDKITCLNYPMSGTEGGKPNPGSVNTLNYLLMTNNNPVSSGGDGIFKNSWVREGATGAMVISEKLILMQFIGEICKQQSLGYKVSDFATDTYNNTPCYSATRPYTGDEKNLSDATLKTYVYVDGGTSNVIVHFRIDAMKKLKFWGIATIGHVAVWADQTVTVTFANPAKNQITTSSSIGKVVPGQDNSAKAKAKKAWTGILNWVTFDWVNAIGNWIDAGSVTPNFNGNLAANIDSGMNKLKDQIVLPAGQEFFFKNAAFAADRMLVIDIDYKE